MIAGRRRAATGAPARPAPADRRADGRLARADQMAQVVPIGAGDRGAGADRARARRRRARVRRARRAAR